MVERILSITTTNSRRGAEVFAVDVAAELARRGLLVDVVGLAEGEGEHRLDIGVLGHSRRGPRTIRALRDRLAEADLVIANGSTTLPLAALATLGTGVPFVYRNVGDPRFWSSTPARRHRAALALRRSSAVVALTGETAYALRERYGVPPERIHVIPKAAPGKNFLPTDDATRLSRRRQLNLPAGPVVLYAGALSAEKRPDLAIEVVAALPFESTLVLAGDGPLRDSVQRLAHDALPGRSRVLGQVPDLSPYLQAADVLLIPSDTEGLPGVAIEAGMTGIPVVATDVGWIREIVVHERTGLVVPRGSRPELVAGIAHALVRRDEFGAEAREHCRSRFEIRQIGERWLELIRSVVAAP